MRRLHVVPGRDLPEYAEPREVYAFQRRAHPDGRPQVEICMVTTADGVIALDGRSGPLGSPTDSSVLGALRSAASWVLVGAETARAENYNAPKRGDLRVAVVSRSGRVDTTASLFASGAGVLVMPEDAPEQPVHTIRSGVGSVDLTDAVMQMGGQFVHVEGGAQINAQLLAAGIVDALNITISPALGGGNGPSFTAPLDRTSTFAMFSLVHLYEHDDFLFARYERRALASTDR